MSSHVLDHVALLSVASRAELANVGSDSFMHPNVVEDAPGPGELLVAFLILANVEGRESALAVSSFFNFTLIVFEELGIDFAFEHIRLSFVAFVYSTMHNWLSRFCKTAVDDWIVVDAFDQLRFNTFQARSTRLCRLWILSLTTC